MLLEKLIEDGHKQRSDLVMQKNIVKEHIVKTLAFIIEQKTAMQSSSFMWR